METGITTWNMNLLEIGAMYPFPGWEMLLAIAGIASWVIWHIVQMKAENKIFEEESKALADKAALRKAMDISNAETLMEAAKIHAGGHTTNNNKLRS